ncbi:MAG: hypothetical protein AAF703_12170 [Cyanobacteria bacterium P01_D01_bin.105]
MISDATSRPGPISPGNVVSAALRIYRDQFKVYFSLSARAILWVLVPVYGWAKYAMHTGLMARMAYQTLTNEPETARQAQKQVNPKMWSFLWIGFLLAFIFIAAYIVFAIVSGVVGFIMAFVVGGLLSSVLGETGIIITSILTGLIALGIFFIGLLQLASRLFIAEVPLAMEDGIGASDSIGRSWSLTKKSIGRIQLVVLATYLVTLPLMLVTNILPQLLLLRMDPTSPAYALLNIVLIVVSIAASIAVLPFWQAAKGVLYYDLRSRREGADLKI